MSAIELANKTKDFVKNSRVTQFSLTLVAGVAIGAIFYPTKHIEETVKQRYEQELQQQKAVHDTETKNLSQQVDTLNQSMKQVTAEKDQKINDLTTQVTQLKSKKVTNYYKIVHPDGTVEVKKSSETDVDESEKVVSKIQEEFKQKVASIETKWETIHKQRVEELQKEFDSKEQTYQKQIAELESKKVEDINPKKFGLEAGAATSTSLGVSGYIHPTMDLFGPIFVGVHGQMGTSPQLGLGLGLRF